MAERLSAADPTSVRRALEVLQAGGLVVMPTDTVYGVGCLAFLPEAVARLYVAKGRPEDKPIPVLLGSASDFDRVAVDLSDAARRLANAFWPGPLTLVVPRHPDLPPEIGPGGTVGVRVPAHPVAQELLDAAGPMAVTSANRTGESPARSAEDAEIALADTVDIVLDDGSSPGGQPSTVIDATLSPPTILRHGPITEADLLEVLG